MLLAVALPTPFVIKGDYDMGFAARGGIHKRKYKIERNGYEGPIEVGLADRQARHLQGVEGRTIVESPAGRERIHLTRRICLRGWRRGALAVGFACRVWASSRSPDGSEHRVSYSSVNQNEQLIGVVGPGKLAMEADRNLLRRRAVGKSFTVPVRIKRGQDVEGPVELELIAPAHLHGLTAAKATIAAKQEEVAVDGDVREQPGPDRSTCRKLVRATLRHNGEPIVAEVKLDVQP